jgi:hypothetical protein
MADTHKIAPASGEKRVLEEALAALQATASQFGAACVNDARMRLQYARDVAAASRELREASEARRISVHEAAAQRLQCAIRLWNLRVVEAAPQPELMQCD